MSSSSDRFTVALEQFSDSLQMVKNQITPGKLTWPLTKEVVKETQSDFFKVGCHSSSFIPVFSTLDCLDV